LQVYVETLIWFN